MEYTNPEIPEGINVSRGHPLKEFFILSLGVLCAVALAVAVLSLLAERLAVYVPFSVEKELVSGNMSKSTADDRITVYLQEISDQLAGHLDLTEAMSFTVHYLDEPVENAYATIGGHIYLYRGLLELLPSENTLAMVMAHEMAHIYHRHPIIALGRGVIIGLLLSAISGLSADRFTGQIVNSTGMIVLLGFNRDQEREADETALATVAASYGHISGADDLFRVLLKRQEENRDYLPQFLSTHPFSDERLIYLQELAAENHWQVVGKETPLPSFIKD